MPSGDPTPWFNKASEISSPRKSSISISTPFLIKVEATKPSHKKSLTMQSSILLGGKPNPDFSSALSHFKQDQGRSRLISITKFEQYEAQPLS